MNKISIYHGSTELIEKPILYGGRKTNDYGFGFYCTEDIELAKEWACKRHENGIVNIYSIDTEGLNKLDLELPKYNILNWIAILLENRTFRINSPVALQTKEYILRNFLPEYQEKDIITGYRADDSYFDYANGFLNNAISVEELEQAMLLGKLGVQFVLKSDRAFDSLVFEGKLNVDMDVYFRKFKERDEAARKEYLESIKKQSETETNVLKNQLYAIDLLRQEVKSDDPRIQRSIFK